MQKITLALSSWPALLSVSDAPAQHDRFGTHSKYENTWSVFTSLYPKTMARLQEANFSPKVFCKGFDWHAAEEAVMHGYRGQGISPPSRERFAQIMDQARNAAIAAAESKLNAMMGDRERPERMLGPCGGAVTLVDVSPRTTLGRFFLSAGREIPDCVVDIDTVNHCLGVFFTGIHQRQEKDVDAAAADAVCKVLSRELAVECYTHAYWD